MLHAALAELTTTVMVADCLKGAEFRQYSCSNSGLGKGKSVFYVKVHVRC